MKIRNTMLILFCCIFVVGCSSDPSSGTQQPAKTDALQSTKNRLTITSTKPAITITITETTTKVPTETPTLMSIVYDELEPLVVSVATHLIASSSHPSAYLPGEMIQANEEVFLVGRDPNGAWLLVISQNNLGWIPAVYSSIGVGTLDLTAIDYSQLGVCMNYLGSMLSLQDAWESNLSGTVIVQGMLYRSPTQSNSGKVDISLHIIDTGQKQPLTIDSTILEKRGEIVSFTTTLEGVEQGFQVKFQVDDNSDGFMPFTASFFNSDCSHEATDTRPGQISGSGSTPISPVATRFVKITTYDSPHLIPTIDWIECHASYPSHLNIGMNAIVISDPALAPDLHEKPYNNTTLLGDLDPNEEVSIVEGPSCSNEIVWWKVISRQTGLIGWVQEGDANNYWLLPLASSNSTPIPPQNGNICKADYQTRLKVGDVAYVGYDPPLPNRVRAKPKTDAEILGKIQPGEEIRIIEGPTCWGGWVWWKIRSMETGLIGWTAEGDTKSYWLIPK